MKIWVKNNPNFKNLLSRFSKFDNKFKKRISKIKKSAICQSRKNKLYWTWATKYWGLPLINTKVGGSGLDGEEKLCNHSNLTRDNNSIINIIRLGN